MKKQLFLSFFVLTNNLSLDGSTTYPALQLAGRTVRDLIKEKPIIVGGVVSGTTALGSFILGNDRFTFPALVWASAALSWNVLEHCKQHLSEKNPNNITHRPNIAWAKSFSEDYIHSWELDEHILEKITAVQTQNKAHGIDFPLLKQVAAKINALKDLSLLEVAQQEVAILALLDNTATLLRWQEALNTLITDGSYSDTCLAVIKKQRWQRERELGSVDAFCSLSPTDGRALINKLKQKIEMKYYIALAKELKKTFPPVSQQLEELRRLELQFLENERDNLHEGDYSLVTLYRYQDNLNYLSDKFNGQKKALNELKKLHTRYPGRLS